MSYKLCYKKQIFKLRFCLEFCFNTATADCENYCQNAMASIPSEGSSRTCYLDCFNFFYFTFSLILPMPRITIMECLYHLTFSNKSFVLTPVDPNKTYHSILCLVARVFVIKNNLFSLSFRTTRGIWVTGNASK